VQARSAEPFGDSLPPDFEFRQLDAHL